MNVNWMTVVIVFGFAGLWLILFWHNAQILPAVVGFDASQHLNYIKYLQEHHRLPCPPREWRCSILRFTTSYRPLVLSLFNLTDCGSISNPSAAHTHNALWYRAVRPGLRDPATDFSRSSQPSTGWRRSGGFSANATLHVTLSDERDLGGSSCFRFPLFCASDGEDWSGNVEKLLCSGAVDRCRAANKGDRCFGSPVYRPGSCPSIDLRASIRHKVGRNTRQHAPALRP